MRRGRVVVTVVGILALTAVLVGRALTPPSPLRAAATRFTLPDVTVIEPARARTRHMAVTVGAGAITMVAPAAPDGVAVLDAYAGAYVLPGLIDMHAHLPPRTPLGLSGYLSFLFLSRGVTTIREAGDGDGTAVEAARAGIRAGRFPGPRIFACGPFVAGAEPTRQPNTRLVRTVADAEHIVAELARAGFVCVKAYEDLSRAKIAALEDAADRHGLHVIGHVPSALAYEEALLPDVQHFFGVPPPASLGRDHILNRTADWHEVDDARLEAIVAATVAHGIANTPTLVSSHQLLLFADYEAARRAPVARLLPRMYRDVVWHPDDGIPIWKGVRAFVPRIRVALAKKHALLGRLHAAGAALFLGTDAQQPFVVPGVSLHQEMAHFVDAGIPLEEVWAIGTWRAAARLPVPGLGTLRPGAPADLLVFREDPTRDLAALDSLAAVVADGRLYARADLERAEAVYRDHFAGFLVDRIAVIAARFAVRRTFQRDY